MGTTALLIMDIQAGIIQRYPQIAPLVEKVNHAIDSARAAGVKIIFVKVGFEPGHPEIGPNSSPNFQAAKANNLFADAASQGLGDLHNQPEDPVVTKKRFSAFAGSTLSMVLRANGITHLILTGVRTAGVVLSTLRYAADEDYKLTVLSDCVTDLDPEIHRVLLEKVFPLQAEVKTSEEWIATLST